MERKRVALLFPGQGSLKAQEKIDILDTSYARELDKKAQNAVGYSIIEMIKNAETDDFTKTSFSQPATFFLSLLSFLILKEEKEVFIVGAAGHSLGEITALTASGFFDIQTGFLIVNNRARAMEMACRQNLGSMLAVIGPSPVTLSRIAGKHGVYVANINSKNQVVFAGPIEGLKNFREEVINLGYKAIYLKVEGAFHTPLMDTAAIEFKKFLTGIKAGYGTFPVISNVDGRPYEENNVIEKMIRQINSPVRWVDCVDSLENLKPDFWVEAYPGNILLKLLPEDVKGKRVGLTDMKSFEAF